MDLYLLPAKQVNENIRTFPRNHSALGYFCEVIFRMKFSHIMYSVSQKKSPHGFLKFFPKRLGIF